MKLKFECVEVEVFSLGNNSFVMGKKWIEDVINGFC